MSAPASLALDCAARLRRGLEFDPADGRDSYCRTARRASSRAQTADRRSCALYRCGQEQQSRSAVCTQDRRTPHQGHGNGFGEATLSSTPGIRGGVKATRDIRRPSVIAAKGRFFLVSPIHDGPTLARLSVISRTRYRFNSYTHMFTAAARFSDSSVPQPAIANGLALSVPSSSCGRPRASLPNR